MLNVPIKFRGVSIKDGRTVYGDLIQSEYRGAVICEIRAQDKHGYPRYETVRDSIAQLVGYDDNGNEVYEGDIVYFNSGENNLSFRVSAGTLLSACDGDAPDLVIKSGNLSHFINE